jgi:hypothetical protein
LLIYQRGINKLRGKKECYSNTGNYDKSCFNCFMQTVKFEFSENKVQHPINRFIRAQYKNKDSRMAHMPRRRKIPMNQIGKAPCHPAHGTPVTGKKSEKANATHRIGK